MIFILIRGWGYSSGTMENVEVPFIVIVLRIARNPELLASQLSVFNFFYFHFVVCWGEKVHDTANSFFKFIYL